MVTTYGRSPGGYVWTILEPVAAISLLSVAFSLALRSPSLGTSFPLFYATGYLPFVLYTDIANKISRSIAFSRPLLRYPRVTYIDAVIARLLTNILTHITVFYVLMFGITQTLNTQIILDIPSIIISLSMAAVLGLGIGSLNCFLFPAFPAWEQIWAILNRPLFIASGILYTFEEVPAGFRDMLWFNPIVHIVGIMRKGYYSTYDAAYASPVYVFGLGLGALMFGLIFLRRYNQKILNNEF